MGPLGQLMELGKGLIPTSGGSPGEHAKSRPGGMDLDHVLQKGAWPRQGTHRGGRQGGCGALLEGREIASGLQGFAFAIRSQGSWLKGVKACRSRRFLLVSKAR